MTGTPRSYQDPCGIARALDAVGERWALLVVRELLHGAKRFAALQQGLPGISPNVLAQRLRELEATGVLHRRELDPPAAVTVYELTDRGAALEPVLLSLGAWGRHQPLTTDRPLGPDALLVALRTTFSPARAATLDVRLDLTLSGARYTVTVRAGALAIHRGAADTLAAPFHGRPPAHPRACLALTTDAATLRELAFGRRDLADALAGGEATLTGPRKTAERLLRAFRP